MIKRPVTNGGYPFGQGEHLQGIRANRIHGNAFGALSNGILGGRTVGKFD